MFKIATVNKSNGQKNYMLDFHSKPCLWNSYQEAEQQVVLFGMNCSYFGVTSSTPKHFDYVIEPA